MHRITSSLALAITTILAASSAARAEGPEGAGGAAGDVPAVLEGGGVEEIVVTAQRREESIQDVPLSVQAFTGAALESAGVDGALELPRLVPNLNIARGTQTANVRVSIRGVGAAGNSAIDPSIGTFIDGVYVPCPGAFFCFFPHTPPPKVLR